MRRQRRSTRKRGRSRSSLTGVVTTDETPARPLRHAIVTATAAEMPGPRQAVTDDDGRFTFPDLPPGRYSLVVEKPGYVKTFYGSKRPGGTPGTPVAVLAGQPAPNIAIRVPRGAVIAGTVRDQFGTPVSGAQVSVKQAVVVNGRRRMADVPNLRVPVATTDDQGRYRIYGLPPGEYAVFCSLPGINYSGVHETNSADVEAVLRELRAGRSAAATSAAAPRQVSLVGRISARRAGRRQRADDRACDRRRARGRRHPDWSAARAQRVGHIARTGRHADAEHHGRGGEHRDGHADRQRGRHHARNGWPVRAVGAAAGPLHADGPRR